MNARKKKRISIIGAGACGPDTAELARTMGRLTAEAGYAIVCGGLGGVMREACAGAKEAGGLTIGVVPDTDRESANEFVDIPIATGLGIMRNALVVANGDIVLAISGEAGTLSEIAMALKTGKTVVALGKWSGLPGVLAADNPEQAMDLIRRHTT